MLQLDKMTLFELETLNDNLTHLIPIYEGCLDLRFSDAFRARVIYFSRDIKLRLENAEQVLPQSRG